VAHPVDRMANWWSHGGWFTLTGIDLVIHTMGMTSTQTMTQISYTVTCGRMSSTPIPVEV